MIRFPLGQNTYDATDVQCMIDSLLSGRFTMGERVAAFEKAFAKYVGSKYAVMVNSGSSANLLAYSALTNHKQTTKLEPGDEVLVPAVCWSTSVFPIIQHGLKPVFVDVDPITLNIKLSDIKNKISNKTKALMVVHVLGNCTDMNGLMSIVKEHNLVLIEDTCESLGSRFDGKYLGVYGKFGTYSFYYSHHITTVEGGMIVCDDFNDYELLKCLRAHGWSRDLSNIDELKEQHPDIDSRFMFVNLGYNLRPMEIQAAMGARQLDKLETKNQNRKSNYSRIVKACKSDPRSGFISFPQAHVKADVAWFGITMFLNQRELVPSYLEYLTKNGVENRPIITGNMVRQPVIKDLYGDLNPHNFPGAEYCHFHGLFTGLSCEPMPDDKIEEFVDILLSYK